MRLRKLDLYLPNLEFQDVNAINNVYSIGFPALTNFAGFGKALELAFIKLYPEYKQLVQFDSIMPIINHMELSDSHAKYISYMKRDQGKVIASTVDYRTLPRLNLTLIVRFAVKIRSISPNQLNQFPNLLRGLIQQQIYSFRLSGGTLHSIDNEGIKVVKAEDLSEFIQTLLPHAYVLENNFEEIVKPWLMEGNDLFNLFSYSKHASFKVLKPEGKYFLLQIGYKLLEQPQVKKFSRAQYPHAFAEPIMAPVRVRKVASYRQAIDLYHTFWGYDNSKLNSGLLLINTITD